MNMNTNNTTTTTTTTTTTSVHLLAEYADEQGRDVLTIQAPDLESAQMFADAIVNDYDLQQREYLLSYYYMIQQVQQVGNNTWDFTLHSDWESNPLYTGADTTQLLYCSRYRGNPGVSLEKLPQVLERSREQYRECRKALDETKRAEQERWKQSRVEMPTVASNHEDIPDWL